MLLLQGMHYPENVFKKYLNLTLETRANLKFEVWF